jgi:hypothetical protein
VLFAFSSWTSTISSPYPQQKYRGTSWWGKGGKNRYKRTATFSGVSGEFSVPLNCNSFLPQRGTGRGGRGKSTNSTKQPLNAILSRGRKGWCRHASRRKEIARQPAARARARASVGETGLFVSVSRDENGPKVYQYKKVLFLGRHENTCSSIRRMCQRAARISCQSQKEWMSEEIKSHSILFRVRCVRARISTAVSPSQWLAEIRCREQKKVVGRTIPSSRRRGMGSFKP